MDSLHVCVWYECVADLQARSWLWHKINGVKWCLCTVYTQYKRRDPLPSRLWRDFNSLSRLLHCPDFYTDYGSCPNWKRPTQAEKYNKQNHPKHIDPADTTLDPADTTQRKRVQARPLDWTLLLYLMSRKGEVSAPSNRYSKAGYSDEGFTIWLIKKQDSFRLLELLKMHHPQQRPSSQGESNYFLRSHRT